MTQEQIDSIRDRMCDEYCQFPHFTLPPQLIEAICNACPLNELEASEEPKKGRWIFARYFVWECSECGKNPTRGMGYTQSKKELFRYCLYCGAFMKMEDEKPL